MNVAKTKRKTKYLHRLLLTLLTIAISFSVAISAMLLKRRFFPKPIAIEPLRMIYAAVPGVGSNGPSPTDQQLQEKYTAALKNAKNGTIQFRVPLEMEESKPETSTVRIYGAKSSAAEKNSFASTGRASLKVLSAMSVSMTEPDNPNSFEITPDEAGRHSGEQFVPDDGYAEWDWTVKPLQGGDQPKKLHITAEMVFYGKLPNGTPARTEIKSYDAVVKVKIKPRAEAAKEWLSENWKDVLKYLVPSGAGATFIVYLLSRKRGRPKEEKEGEGDDDEEDDEGTAG